MTYSSRYLRYMIAVPALFTAEKYWFSCTKRNEVPSLFSRSWEAWYCGGVVYIFSGSESWNLSSVLKRFLGIHVTKMMGRNEWPECTFWIVPKHQQRTEFWEAAQVILQIERLCSRPAEERWVNNSFCASVYGVWSVSNWHFSELVPAEEGQ